MGHSELILAALSDGDPVRDHAEEVRQAADRAATLTRQLLAFSRRQLLQLRVLDLNALITGVTRMLRRLIGEHIEIETDLAPDLYPVRADAGQMEQVVLNLAVNARDAMPEGGRLTLRTDHATVDTSRFFDATGCVPVFWSRKQPVPYVFFASPGATHIWPKSAACWSPAMPAIGSPAMPRLVATSP